MYIASPDLSPELRASTCPLHVSTWISNRHPIKKPTIRKKHLDKYKRIDIKPVFIRARTKPRGMGDVKKARGGVSYKICLREIGKDEKRGGPNFGKKSLDP